MPQNQDLDLRTVPRTLCVGIGGTGYQVLGQVRKLMVEQYGDLELFPIVRFVHLDTDTGNPPILGGTNIYRGVDLSFQDTEKVRTYVSQAQIQEFLGEIRATLYPEREPNNHYRHIAQWFPRELNENIPALEHGAAGIRAVGRLTFFLDYLNFQNKIRDAVAKTQNPNYHELVLDRWNLLVDGSLHIMVVCSLCGGTGSGMFLDVAYALRRLYPGALITGYLVIAPELYGGNLRQQANTYAALKELNYYSTPGSVFEACYSWGRGIFINENYEGLQRPFDYTFLVGQQTEQNAFVVQEKKTLFTLIAQKIASEFHPELGPNLRARRVNFDPLLIGYDRHPRQNIQCYLAFGISAIYIPQDEVNQGVLNSICIQLLNFWIEGEQSLRGQKILESFLVKYKWGRIEDFKTQGFAEVILATALENNRGFRELMQTRRSQYRRRIEDCQTQDGRRELISYLERETDDLLYKVLVGQVPSQRGNWIRKLQEERQELILKLQRELQDFLAQLLTPTTDEFGIQNARNWLDALNYALREYEESATAAVRDSQFYTLEELNQQWQGIRQRVDEIERERHIWGGNHKKNTKVREQANRALTQALNQIEQNYQAAVTRENLEVVLDLRPYVQQLIQEMTELNTLVTSLKERTSRQQDQVVQAQGTSQMTGLALADQNDVNDCFQRLIPQKERRNKLSQQTNNVLVPYGGGQGSQGVKSLSLLLDKDKQWLEQSLIEEIWIVVSQDFSSQTAESLGSVVQRFNEKYPGNQANPRLQRIYNQSKPLLPINKELGHYIWNPEHEFHRIGFTNTGDQAVQQFKETLTRNIQNISETDFVETSSKSKSKITFIQEYAGFPLRLISGLKALRDQYDIAKNQGNTLHTHRSEEILFFDIIPPNWRKQEQIQKTLIQALAFKTIETITQPDRQGEEQQRLLIFKYRDDFLQEDEEYHFSPLWEKSTEQILINPDLRQKLGQKLNQIKEGLKGKQNEWKPMLQNFYRQIKNLKKEDCNHRYQQQALKTISELWREMESHQATLPSGNQEALPEELDDNTEFDDDVKTK
jgi:hypothetical protein